MQKHHKVKVGHFPGRLTTIFMGENVECLKVAIDVCNALGAIGYYTVEKKGMYDLNGVRPCTWESLLERNSELVYLKVEEE